MSLAYDPHAYLYALPRRRAARSTPPLTARQVSRTLARREAGREGLSGRARTLGRGPYAPAARA